MTVEAGALAAIVAIGVGLTDVIPLLEAGATACYSNCMTTPSS